MTIGPWPKHEVVLMAVRKAVSAATITFTASSMILCFFMIRFFLFSRNEEGGARPKDACYRRDARMRKEITRWYGGAGDSLFEAGGARLLCGGIVCP